MSKEKDCLALLKEARFYFTSTKTHTLTIPLDSSMGQEYPWFLESSTYILGSSKDHTSLHILIAH